MPAFIPEGYQIEYIPENIMIESTFGRYEVKVQINREKVIYIRRYENNSGIFPKKEYGNFVDFYKKMAKSDKEQMVLVKL